MERLRHVSSRVRVALLSGAHALRFVLWFAVLSAPMACMLLGSPVSEPVARSGWAESHGPLIPHDRFPTDCSLCHLGGDWSRVKEEIDFDHEKETGFPLYGAHRNAQCLRCHNDRGPVAVFANRGCRGCHEDRHQGYMGTDCGNCHSMQTWKPEGQLGKHSRTRFPLLGSHAAVACYRCHPGAEVGNFQRATTNCEDCHASDLARTQNPDHNAQGWTSGCERCHKPTAWSGGQFAHSLFPLVGHHQSARCTDCHKNGVFTGLDSACYSCHSTDYTNTSSPQHTAAGFSTDCSACHSPVGWNAAGYTHTVWPLVGQHQGQQCSKCHTSNIYSGLSKQCSSCHMSNYNATSSPKHTTAGFPTTCDLCHTPVAWDSTGYSHSHWPLTGQHQGKACSACHTGSVYSGLPSQCKDCHTSNYNNTTNPNHSSYSIPMTCESCHTTAGWGSGFSHSFTLKGDHNTSCSTCHTTLGNFQVFTCFNCHFHRKSNMDSKHSSVSGYSYSAPACITCHPKGK